MPAQAPCPCQTLLRAESPGAALQPAARLQLEPRYFSHPRSGSQQIISEIPSPLHAHFRIVLTASAGSLAGTAREGKAPRRALATAVLPACWGCAICAADAPCLSSRPEGSEAGCCRWHQEALAKTGHDDREGSTSDRAASLPNPLTNLSCSNSAFFFFFVLNARIKLYFSRLQGHTDALIRVTKTPCQIFLGFTITERELYKNTRKNLNYKKTTYHPTR